jgi:hypothetical protein
MTSTRLEILLRPWVSVLFVSIALEKGKKKTPCGLWSLPRTAHGGSLRTRGRLLCAFCVIVHPELTLVQPTPMLDQGAENGLTCTLVAGRGPATKQPAKHCHIIHLEP